MPNGEKVIPFEALPTQERIAQILGERSVSVEEDETLGEAVIRLREEEGKSYNLARSSIIFRTLE